MSLFHTAQILLKAPTAPEIQTRIPTLILKALPAPASLSVLSLLLLTQHAAVCLRALIPGKYPPVLPSSSYSCDSPIGAELRVSPSGNTL